PRVEGHAREPTAWTVSEELLLGLLGGGRRGRDPVWLTKVGEVVFTILSVGLPSVSEVKNIRREGHHRLHVRHPLIPSYALDDRQHISLKIGDEVPIPHAIFAHSRHEILRAHRYIKHRVSKSRDVDDFRSEVRRAHDTPSTELHWCASIFELDFAIDRTVRDIIMPRVGAPVASERIVSARTSVPSQYDQSSAGIRQQVTQRFHGRTILGALGWILDRIARGR